MATISNTPRPGYAWDSTDNVWYPIGTGPHTHADYITSTSAINPTIVDAKGDIIAATAADTVARLAVGNNGETLVADSTATTGLRWQGNYSAGKNKIINGDFGVWQRGTSFSVAGSSAGYTADRWRNAANGTGGTITVSQQTFTAGTAPVAGYEGTYFCRYATTVVGTGASYNAFFQPIEDVRTFAGQTVTVSFWAKAAATTSVSMTLEQNFGTSGSGTVVTTIPAFSITTSWTRFSYSVAVPSVSGKTIGTGSNLQYVFQLPYATTSTVDFWGTQIEAGSTATAFQTATGTTQGELAACQRYYYRISSDASSTYALFNTGGYFTSTTIYSGNIQNPITMRTVPSSIDFANLSVQDSSGTFYAVSAIAVDGNTDTTWGNIVTATVSGATAGRFGRLITNSSSSAYIGFSAEL
jgi:hypothetical protein